MGRKGKDGGFSAHLLDNYDRGYATGTVELNNDAIVDYEKASSGLCEDCLEDQMNLLILYCPGRYEK